MLPLVLLLLVRPALARLENVDVLLSDATPWYYVAKFGYATGDSAWVRSRLRRLLSVCALCSVITCSWSTPARSG